MCQFSTLISASLKKYSKPSSTRSTAASSRTMHSKGSMWERVRYFAVERFWSATFRIPGKLLFIFPAPIRIDCSEIREFKMNFSLPSSPRLLARWASLLLINVKSIYTFFALEFATRSTNVFPSLAMNVWICKRGISCRICTGFFIEQ